MEITTSMMATGGILGILGLATTLILMAFAMVPVIFVFKIGEWMNRFKALAVWSFIMAIIVGVVILLGDVPVDVSTVVMAIIGGFITYFIIGLVVMVLADYLGEPMADYIILVKNWISGMI